MLAQFLAALSQLLEGHPWGRMREKPHQESWVGKEVGVPPKKAGLSLLAKKRAGEEALGRRTQLLLRRKAAWESGES